MTHTWTDDCCESGVAPCNTDVLNDNLMYLRYDLLDTLYPIGSIYIGTMSICPLAVLGIGIWQLVATDRVLQGSGVNSAGSTVEAGLPNITGKFSVGGGNYLRILNTNGAFSESWNSGGTDVGGSDPTTANRQCDFNASNSSSIYGNSNTVQPPAYIVNIWERIS